MSQIINNMKHANQYFEFLNSRPQKKYTSYDAYFKDLDEWFDQTYCVWNLTAKFPYYLAQQQEAQKARLRPPASQSAQPASPQSASQNGRDNQQDEFDGLEGQIPALWKRVAAEFVDFLLLLCVKLALAYIALHFNDLISDWDKLSEELFDFEQKLEYKAFLQVTHGVVLLEIGHRVVVCIFETIWLSSGPPGRIGGATPGKSLFGLRVVRCELIIDLPRTDPNSEPRVIVKPATDLGLQASFFRALIKNMILTFFIPASFTPLYLTHNRTVYDTLCNTVVIEEPITRHRRVVRAQFRD